MGQTIRLGRIGGIAIGANWSVAVIAVIIAWMLAVSALPASSPHQPRLAYWAAAIITTIVFLASLLAHEVAHALVARRNNVGVKSITLWMLGGVTDLETNAPNPGADFRIAIAGPLTSLIAAGVCFGLGEAIAITSGPPVAIAAAEWLTLINVLLAVFNLLPGAPLDGGRVLRAVLWRAFRDRERADRAAVRTGQFLGFVIAGLGLAELLVLRMFAGLWLMLIGWFLVTAAIAEQRAAVAQAALSGLRVADVMTPNPVLAPGWRGVADFAGEMAWSHQEAFPVIGFDGELTGVVLTSQLARLPAADRARLRLDQVALPVPAGYRATPDGPADQLITRRPIGGEVAAVVIEEGKVTGIVTLSDLERALRRHQSLRPSRPPRPA